MLLNITIEGDSTSDLEMALDEVRRLLAQGCTSGNNSNDTGRFSFDVSGENPDDR